MRGTGLRKLESARCYRQRPPKRTLWMQSYSRTLLERAAVMNVSCFESSLYILTEIKSQAACGGRDPLPQQIIAHEGGRLVGVGGHLIARARVRAGNSGHQLGLQTGANLIELHCFALKRRIRRKVLHFNLQGRLFKSVAQLPCQPARNAMPLQSRGEACLVNGTRP